MIGYWIVMAILACALVAVVVALAGTDIDQDDAPPVTKPFPRSSAVVARQDLPAAALPVRSPATPPVTWVAVSSSGLLAATMADADQADWVDRIASDLPEAVVVHHFDVADSTLVEVRREQIPAAIAMRPDVVSCWLGVNDFLQGVSLESFARDLAITLDALRTTGARIVVGTIPDLTGWPGAPDGADPDALRRQVSRWNASIAQLAIAHGAEVAAPHAEQSENVADVTRLGAAGSLSSTPMHNLLADCFRPPIQRVVASVQSRRMPSDLEDRGRESPVVSTPI